MALNCIFLGQNRLILAGFFCCLEKSSLWKLWLLMLEESRSFLWGLCTKCVILPFLEALPKHMASQYISIKDYWCPMMPFFNNIPNFWANWADRPNKFWGIFSQTISPHFGTVSPMSMISIIQLFFLQKTLGFRPNLNISQIWYWKFGK